MLVYLIFVVGLVMCEYVDEFVEWVVYVKLLYVLWFVGWFVFDGYVGCLNLCECFIDIVDFD